MSEHTYFHDLFLIYFNDSLKVVHFSLNVLRILIFSKHFEHAFSPPPFCELHCKLQSQRSPACTVPHGISSTKSEYPFPKAPLASCCPFPAVPLESGVGITHSSGINVDIMVKCRNSLHFFHSLFWQKNNVCFPNTIAHF